MAINTVRDALYTVLDNLALGVVDTTEGRSEDLPFIAGSGYAPKALLVSRFLGSGSAPGVEVTRNSHCTEYEFMIHVYYPYEFASSSELAFDAILESIRSALSISPALIPCSITFEPVISKRTGYIMYPTADAGVLCHYAEITFRAQKWETY